jgi:hypothetical protein
MLCLCIALEAASWRRLCFSRPLRRIGAIQNGRSLHRKRKSRDTEFGTGFIRHKSPAGYRVARVRQSQTVTNDLSINRLSLFGYR